MRWHAECVRCRSDERVAPRVATSTRRLTAHHASPAAPSTPVRSPSVSREGFVICGVALLPPPPSPPAPPPGPPCQAIWKLNFRAARTCGADALVAWLLGQQTAGPGLAGRSVHGAIEPQAITRAQVAEHEPSQQSLADDFFCCHLDDHLSVQGCQTEYLKCCENQLSQKNKYLCCADF